MTMAHDYKANDDDDDDDDDKDDDDNDDDDADDDDDDDGLSKNLAKCKIKRSEKFSQ